MMLWVALLHGCKRYVAFLVILAETRGILFPVKNAFYGKTAILNT